MNHTIVLIEDNEQNRYLVRFLLTQYGYDVIEFTDGPRALEAMEGLEPAAILLDIQLPLMDGYAVARALRMHAHLALTPIIAVTSYAMPGDRERALESGCSAYIEKPIDPQTFVSDVERAILCRAEPNGDAP